MRVVKEVKEVRFHPQTLRFGAEPRLFRDREIPVLNARTTYVADTRIAEGVGGRGGEATGIEPLLNRFGGGDAGASDIGAIAARVVIQQVVGDADQQWLTSLEGRNSVDGPAAQKITCRA